MGTLKTIIQHLSTAINALPLFTGQTENRILPVVKCVLAITILFRLWLVAGTEIQAFPYAGHDDGLYVRIAYNILHGNWLGDYDQYILIKAPIFPIFLAACYVLSIPILLAQEILYCAAVILVLMALRPLLKSPLSYFLIGLPLILCPVTLNSSRIIRDQLYTSLLLGLAACVIALVLRCNQSVKQNIYWSIGLGILMALIWDTREEGITILPFLALAAILFLLGNLKSPVVNKLRDASSRLLSISYLPILIFAIIHFTLCTINYSYYGLFGTCEIKTKAFGLAFGTLTGIDADQKTRYIPISEASLDKAYATSETMRTLKSYLDGQGSDDWKHQGYELVSSEQANEFKGDWFKWAFRDAVAQVSNAKSWRETDAFYDRIYKELISGFESDALQGTGSRYSEVLPVMDFRLFVPLIANSFLKGVKQVVTFSDIQCLQPTIIPEGGGLDIKRLKTFERLTGNRSVQPTTGRVRGWVFTNGTPGTLELVSPNGSSCSFGINREMRPDVRDAFSYLPKNEYGYGFSAEYVQGDKLRILDSSGNSIALIDLQPGASFTSSDNNIQTQAHIDDASLSVDRLLTYKYSIRKMISTIYRKILPTIEIIGLLSFLAILIRCPFFVSIQLISVTLMLITLVFTRILALAFIDVAIFPGFGYASPVYPLFLLLILLPTAIPLSFKNFYKDKPSTMHRNLQ